MDVERHTVKQQDANSAEMKRDPLLTVEDLRISFRTDSGLIRAVNGVSLAAFEGRTLGIVGESGSGKSVTARALMGLLPVSSTVIEGGSIKLSGRELLDLPEREWRSLRGRDLAMVFQDPMRSLNPTMRVGAQIAEAIRLSGSLTRAATRQRVLELLTAVRIPDAKHFVDAYPHQLSGGMRQRVVIAIALSCRPKLLIADEPTTALDVTTQAQILDLLIELQMEFGMGIIMITHDLGVAAQYTDDIVIMYAGRVVESAPTSHLFANVRMPYTRGLLDSIPSRSPSADVPLPYIPGAAPDPAQAQVGCAFSPRCAYSQDLCRTESPPLVESESDHAFACWYPLGEPLGGERVG